MSHTLSFFKPVHPHFINPIGQRIGRGFIVTSALILPASFIGCSPHANTAVDGGAPTDAQSSMSDSQTPPTDGANTPLTRVGEFRAEIVRIELSDPQTTLVTARVYDGPPPPAEFLHSTMTEGDCALKVVQIPFCQNRCGANALCVADGVCQTFPSLVDVGMVSFTGLARAMGDGPAVLTQTMNNYALEDGVLQFPAFTEGGMLGVSVAGGSGVAPFTMSIPAMDQMTVLTTMLVSRPNEAMEVRWRPPMGPVPEGQDVLVGLDFTHHAGLRGRIECVTADDGSVTLPAALVTGLHALGSAGFPTIFVTRRITRTMTVGTQQMTLSIVSEKELYVDVPGIRSCHEDTECAPGERCRMDFTCGM